jgi:hypothetical protein
MLMIDRFNLHIDRSGDCWEWTASKFKSGYGIFTINKKPFRAHRIAFTLYKMPSIPDGLHVLHKCDNPSCVNPDHLFLGTHQDNMTDMCKKGRHVTNPLKGETAVNSKLTDDQVKSIKKDTRLQRIIAAEYGVHQVLISRIKTGKAWVHV